MAASPPGAPLAQLSGARRELLARALRAAGLTAADATIPRRSVRAAAPLSFAQERLWFLDRLEPGSPRYNLASLLRVRGPFLPRAFEQALDALGRRHEALRTSFR